MYGKRTARFLILFTIALAGCGPGAGSSEYVVLTDSADPLRSAFNADSGKVRAILLASPT